jgi:hypothetical protein
MDAKIWALIAVGVFFVGIASTTNYFAKLDAAQHSLREAQQELKFLEEEVEDNFTSADSKLAKTEEDNQLVAVHDGLVAKKKALEEEIKDLEGRKSAGMKVFRDVVTDVRAKSVGIPWADVPFRNGQMLRQVRIQKVTETEVTLAHSEGVARLTAEELPAELKDKFRLGMEPFTDKPGDSAKPSVVPSVPMPTTTSSQPSASVRVQTPAEVEAEINAYDNKVINMEATKAQMANRASALRSQVYAAQSAGRPSYNLNQQATQAEQQLAAYEQQIVQARFESEKLRSKLIQVRNEYLRARTSGSQR